jgi:Flp pilus assembly protein TadG
MKPLCRCADLNDVLQRLSLQLREHRGMAGLYGIIIMVALTAITSIAVDIGRVQLAKSELQSATDAAARYAATGMKTDVATVKARAVSAAASNTVNGTPLVLDPNLDIEFGTWNSATKSFVVLTGAAQSTANSIRVTGRRIASRSTAIPLVFASVLGQRSCDLQASSIVSINAADDDVFLIQDITTSFSAELPDAKIADQALLDALKNAGGSARFGIAVHTGWGTTLAPLQRISTNYSFLTSKISSIQLAGSSGMPVASGTDIASGFDEAITAYTASGYVAPTSGVKSVILVSDGQPSADSDGKHPTLNSSQLLTLAQTRANTLWTNKVHVYVVFMDAANDTAAATKLQTLIRGDGDFVRVSTPSQLPTALADLTKKIGGVSLVK